MHQKMYAFEEDEGEGRKEVRLGVRLWPGLWENNWRRYCPRPRSSFQRVLVFSGSQTASIEVYSGRPEHHRHGRKEEEALRLSGVDAMMGHPQLIKILAKLSWVM